MAVYGTALLISRPGEPHTEYLCLVRADSLIKRVNQGAEDDLQLKE